jgi:hypothetical protein
MTDLRPLRLTTLLVACALALAGCGKSSSPTAPAGPAMTQDGADDAAQMSLLALDQLGLDAMGGAGLILVPTSSTRRIVVPGEAARETTFTLGALNVSLDWRFYDPQDVELPDYGLTAVKLVWTSHIRGAIETARDTAVVRHHGHLTFTGIQPAGGSYTIDGAAADTLIDRFRSLDGGLVRDGSWKSALVLDAVVQPRALGAPPSSGTLTFTVRVDRYRSGSFGTVERSWSAVVVVAFDGTTHPPVTVNGTWHYTWNMATGTMTRA